MIGIDIIEIERIKKFYEKNPEAFLKKIFSIREIEIIKEIRSKLRLFEFMAGRFAAKESFMKAVGKGIKIGFSKIEILNNEEGKPYIVYNEKIYENVSISHSKKYAVAVVIV